MLFTPPLTNKVADLLSQAMGPSVNRFLSVLEDQQPKTIVFRHWWRWHEPGPEKQ
jgi:hypothetical protein